eukprot:gene27136-32780_t
MHADSVDTQITENLDQPVPHVVDPKDAEAVRMKYSTTSSVYAEYSMSNPKNNEVAYCIGALIQAQIFDDSDCRNLPRDAHPEFEMSLILDGNLGGPIEKIPDHILAHETVNDTELRDKLLAGLVPTVDSIYRFISYLHLSAKFSAQCNIIALIYMNRITASKSNRFALTASNWRGIWVAAILIAQKFMDDTPLKTSSFTALLPNVTKMQLREMELKGFCMLESGGGAIVKPSVYAKYYFELRALFLDIVGADRRYDWNLKPLTILQGMIMEDRSTRLAEQAKITIAQKQSTSTPLSRTPLAAPTPSKWPGGQQDESISRTTSWGEGKKKEAKDSESDSTVGSGMTNVTNKVSSAKKTPLTPSRTLEDVTFTSPSTRYVLS